jgi:opacity protein-like surface antigen
MKRLQATVATLALGLGLAHAGPVIDKNPVPVDPSCPCFYPGLQVGAFASGYLPRDEQAEDALGGGVAFTYYFTENIGLEYSYAVHATDSEKHINALDLMYRLPVGMSCLAPYLMGGGAIFSNGENNWAWRLGAGVEYRLQNLLCSAIFADGTYNWTDGETDAVQVRLGLRVPF